MIGVFSPIFNTSIGHFGAENGCFPPSSFKNVLNNKKLSKMVYIFLHSFVGKSFGKFIKGKCPFHSKLWPLSPFSTNKMSDEEEFEEIERIVLGLDEVG